MKIELRKHNIVCILLILFTLASCEESGEDNFISEKNPTQNSGEDTVRPDITAPDNPLDSLEQYKPIGVGGGGAMSGLAMSPYSNLWLVGTDMGTLFRSTDQGISWNAINHNEAVFSSHLPDAVTPGFSSDGVTVFHASGGYNPTKSEDSAKTFQSINMNLMQNEVIRYWANDSFEENRVYAGTNLGLLKSSDNGVSWSRITEISGESQGTYIDYNPNGNIIYHANEDKIYISVDYGESFQNFYNPTYLIRGFTGARDHIGLTLATIDDNGEDACSWAEQYRNLEGSYNIDLTYENCGYVWVNKNLTGFTRTDQASGNHIVMAENDSDTIYVTGGKEWIRQRGTAVNVSHDAGETWQLKLNQMNWEDSYTPWPSHKIEYSAIAMDVGWWDSGYESFTVNKRDSNLVGGTGYFFLHISENAGDYWRAPFTEYKDYGEKAPKKNWQTRGIEVISVYKVEFHPENPDLMYVASADIGGLVSEDHGEKFRVAKAEYNSNYDYSFDINNQDIVYAASGNTHDWPESWYANAIKSNGGIYKSEDKGLNWTRLTPKNNNYNRQFLSVGYDSINDIIYGGSHEVGIIRSTDQGNTWKPFNKGLPSSNKIIPQIEVNPYNGNVYALLTGDAPQFTNNKKTGIYFLDVENGSKKWKLLRKKVRYPQDADSGYKLWYYPTSFAVDFSNNNQDTLYLTDYENNGNWLMTGVWKSTDHGKNWERKLQLTHAAAVKIDPTDVNNIYASGSYTLAGNWGNGGQYHSADAGQTWTKNITSPLQANARNVTVDPKDSSKVFYTYFGGGILYGDK